MLSRHATGFEKEKKKIFKKLGLVAAQCNGIAACAYSLKIYLEYRLVLTQLYCIWSDVVRPLCIFFLDKRVPNNPV